MRMTCDGRICENEPVFITFSQIKMLLRGQENKFNYVILHKMFLQIIDDIAYIHTDNVFRKVKEVKTSVEFVQPEVKQMKDNGHLSTNTALIKTPWISLHTENAELVKRLKNVEYLDRHAC